MQRRESKYIAHEIGHLKKFDFTITDVDAAEAFLEALKGSNTSLVRANSFGSLTSDTFNGSQIN